MLYRHVAILVFHFRQPSKDRWKICEIEATLVRHARVGIERYISDAEAIADEKLMLRKVLIHHSQGSDSTHSH